MTEPERHPETELPERDPSRVDVSLERNVWVAWWFGTILIVLSWADVVSATTGWIGSGIAAASALVSVIANRYWRLPGGRTK